MALLAVMMITITMVVMMAVMPSLECGLTLVPYMMRMWMRNEDGAVGGDDHRYHHYGRDDDSYTYTGMLIGLGGVVGWR